MSIGALLTCLASLNFTAYEQWSGPTPGWAAPIYSFVGFLVFCGWLGEGAPATPRPHDLDLSRFEIAAAATGFCANVLLAIGLLAGVLGAQRRACRLGWASLSFGLASILLLWLGVPMFRLRSGAVLWVAAMWMLTFSRPTGSRETEASNAPRSTLDSRNP
jgi:hypothetical protein